MILINNTYNKRISKRTYVALGNFDGIHRGHLTLIDEVLNQAKSNNELSMVYTFENHPLYLIDKNRAPKLLMDNKSKIEFLDNIGIDILCLDEFNQKVMTMNPNDFIRNLVKTYNVKGIVVGFNYRFGYKNLGDLNLLKTLSNELGFKLLVKEAFLYNNEVVSSTKIRERLENGNIQEASAMLGRYYMLRGIVVDGKKLGRTIGFPTANLKVNEENMIPKIGVYYTNVEIDGKKYKGITSIGNNPTVNGKNITIETYILDFDRNIYGEEIKLYFISHIRDEKKFKGLDELKLQLKKDKDFAAQQDIKI